MNDSLFPMTIDSPTFRMRTSMAFTPIDDHGFDELESFLVPDAEGFAMRMENPLRKASINSRRRIHSTSSFD